MVRGHPNASSISLADPRRPWRVDLNDAQDEVFVVNDVLHIRVKPTSQLISHAIRIRDALNRVYS